MLADGTIVHIIYSHQLTRFASWKNIRGLSRGNTNQNTWGTLHLTRHMEKNMAWPTWHKSWTWTYTSKYVVVKIAKLTNVLKIFIWGITLGLFICSRWKNILPFMNNPFSKRREYIQKISYLPCNLDSKTFHIKIPQTRGSKLTEKNGYILHSLVTSGLRKIIPGFWTEYSFSWSAQKIPDSWSPCDSAPDQWRLVLHLFFSWCCSYYNILLKIQTNK